MFSYSFQGKIFAGIANLAVRSAILVVLLKLFFFHPKASITNVEIRLSRWADAIAM